ncbi:IS110 family transposase ISRhru3 [Asticcacaulis sp. MM231]|uniref:IS110 family transposase n=1 Tax=Asticcacaulis sp. MM231 TaxID=3157666 RepID=UPI0032D5878D
MKYYAGIDVSLERSSVCVVDAAGKICREGEALSDPESLVAWFAAFGAELELIGLEAGPLSQWLYAEMTAKGLSCELIETRHVRTAFKIMPVKTDKKDARGIAQLMRLGWFRPVHCKSQPAQEVRAVLTARKLLQTKLLDIEKSLRGILRGFGLKVGAISTGGFEARILELCEGHETLTQIARSILDARQALLEQFNLLHRKVLAMAKADQRTCRLMTIPGVGPLTSLTFVSAIDQAERFSSSRDIGPHFGLTPRKYQSGETDYTGRISKTGDASVRTALYEAANTIMIRPSKAIRLKAWATAIATRSGLKKAKVALARKLGVIMHAMLRNGQDFAATQTERAAMA